MESEDVNEQRRFAAACDVKQWDHYREIFGRWREYWGRSDTLFVRLKIGWEQWPIYCEINDGKTASWISQLEPTTLWDATRSLSSFVNERVGHIIYRLGIEDEVVVTQFPALSAHEKLELRLSMPREFWPQSWLDEDK